METTLSAERQRELHFIADFKKLLASYGYSDKLILKGDEQDISIQISSKIKGDGFIQTAIKKAENNIRSVIVKGRVIEVVPEEAPEDAYDTIKLDISIKRIEEAVELVNRTVDISKFNKDELDYFNQLNQ